LILAAAFALAALLGACGADDPSGGTTVTVGSVVTAGTPTAGLSTCTSCHASQTAQWEGTKHANLDSSPSYTTTASCAGCHDRTGDSQQLAPVRMVVACEACHSGGQMHASAGGAGPIGFSTLTSSVLGSVSASAQFMTCTACHELLNSSGTGTSAPLTPVWHNAGMRITDTHFASSPYDASTGKLITSTAGVTAVTGYAMAYNNERVCIDCHNPHGTASINKEWAQSAHADVYGGSTQYFVAAWARTNWSLSSSKACQRCHTTTGMVAYAEALRSGDGAKANDIRDGVLATLPSVTAWNPEMLKCNGCHTDYKGSIRNPGAITADYDFVSGGKTYAKASHAYPDVFNSNVCMLCHTARESGDTLKGLNDSYLLSTGTISFFDFSNNSLISSHYLTGGGTVFRATGYTFAGRDYTNPSSYVHDKIGTNAAPNTGTGGPCVGCHMSRPNKNGNHIFMPVTRSLLSGAAPAGKATATITGIASQVCWNCHDKNDALLLDQIDEQKLLFEESLAALVKLFEIRDLYWYDGFKKVVTKGTATLVDATTVELVSTASISATTDLFRFTDEEAYYKITSVGSTTIAIAPYAGSIATGSTGSFVIINADRTAGVQKNWLTQVGPVPLSLLPLPDTDTSGARTGRNNMGAAFNFALLEGEPAAYVHNRYYTKRLIYDSLDWIDDNQMNYSTGVTLNAACNGGSGDLAACEAMKYVLVGAQQNPYSAAERP
jgi:hypothetical protein